METNLKPGKYIVAVSGGVDSMVLLHLLISHIPSPNPKLIIAHFDHGIRPSSEQDCDFAASKAKESKLKFVSEKGNLGKDASEATAREARYKFLRKVKKQYDADAILTAHHQDDLIETILINVIRGTAQRGLTSLSSNDKIIRPLLDYPKKQILEYARKNAIKWKEDPTNKDTKYLRNYLRIKILPKMSLETRKKLLKIANESKIRNDEIKEIIENITTQKNYLDRQVFNRLDHSSSREVLADFLRNNNIAFDSKLLEKGVNFIKTGKPAKKFVLPGGYYFKIREDKVELNLL
jgi:tRNA(Ile)-lysidine synthase